MGQWLQRLDSWEIGSFPVSTGNKEKGQIPTEDEIKRERVGVKKERRTDQTGSINYLSIGAKETDLEILEKQYRKENVRFIKGETGKNRDRRF